MTIEEKTIKKYAKRGKPTRTSDKTVNVTYHVNLVIGGRDEALYEKWLKQESCFVLVSNTPKERCNPAELFREYKEQWVVEDKFKFLKQPVVLGPIWLQKPEEIKGASVCTAIGSIGEHVCLLSLCSFASEQITR